MNEKWTAFDSACSVLGPPALVHCAVSLRVLPTTLPDGLHKMSQSPIKTK